MNRDAHLLAALRHAPDADARPSAALTQAILDAARRASAARPGWRERWAAWWQPAPLAAFATLALGTVIGVLWVGGDRVPPDATPSLRAPAASPAPSAPALMADAARRVAVPAADPPAAPPPATLPRQPGTRERAAVESRASAPTVAPSAARGDSAAAAPPPAAPPADRAAAPKAAPAEQREDHAAAAPAPAPEAMVADKPSADSAAPGLRREDAAPRLAGSAAPADDPWRSVRALLVEHADRLRWRLAASSRDLAHQPAQREWALAFDAATRGRWRRVMPTDAASPTLTLYADGRPVGTLSLDSDHALWRDAGGAQWWAAELPAELIADWRQRIAGW